MWSYTRQMIFVLRRRQRTSRVCRISFGEVISTWLYMWQHSPFAKKSESLLNTDTHHSHYIFIYSPVLDATTFVRSLSPLISPPSSPPYSVKSDECGVQQVQHHICVFVTRHTHARASLRRLHSELYAVIHHHLRRSNPECCCPPDHQDPQDAGGRRVKSLHFVRRP